ncbi:MAG: hypothetical protein R3A10_07770 [Caldilineaceae bacterium]
MPLGPDGRILDAMRRVRADEDDGKSGPDAHYTPPPAQDKLPPLDDGADDYYANLQRRMLMEPGPLWRAHGRCGRTVTLGGAGSGLARDEGATEHGRRGLACGGASLAGAVDAGARRRGRPACGRTTTGP